MAAAEAEAERNHWAAVIAVVDDGGLPILIERMDHAANMTCRSPERELPYSSVDCAMAFEGWLDV